MKTKQKLLITILVCGLLWMASCREGSPISSPVMTTRMSTLSLRETVEPSRNITHTIQPSTTQLKTTPTLTKTPFFSQPPNDQNVIAFTGTGEDRDNQEIYLVYVNSLRLVNLTKNPAADFMPAWSLDGSRIAFISSRNNQSLQIYVMNADGSDVQQITESDLIPLHSPSWSPDGMKIVFDALYQDDFAGIFIVDLSTKEITALVTESSSNLDPAWSPDGKQIAFSSNRDNQNEYDLDIFTLDLATNEILRLTMELESDYSPDWSPDGKQIAFSRYINDWPFIYIMEADGSNPRMITPAKISRDQEGGGSPSWSGDGSIIAFQNTVPIVEGPILDWLNSVWVDSIFIMKFDGSGTIRLTFGDLLAEYPDWRP